MHVTRYIVIQAIKTPTNELIPFWSDRLKHEHLGDCGDSVLLDNYSSQNYFGFVDCIYDMKTRTISAGIELNHYPDQKHLEFKIDESVYYEVKNKEIGLSKLVSIDYINYDLTIVKGYKLEDYQKARFKDMEFDDNALYVIKDWKPTYVLESGFKTEYSFKLYHVAKLL